MTMRCIIALVLTFILCLLSACGADDSAPSPDHTLNPTSSASDMPTAPMPNATDALTIYANPYLEKTIDTALQIFQKQFPDVTVNYREFNGTDYAEKWFSYRDTIKTELMAGKGPDLVIAYAGDFDDIYKVAESGIFCDLNPFLSADPDYIPEDYNQAVLEGGIIGGKRVFVPLFYRVMLLLTTQEALNAAKFTVSQPPSLSEFTAQAAMFYERYGSSKFLFDTQYAHLGLLYPWTGAPELDYENKALRLDDLAFRQVMDLYKALYDMDTVRYGEFEARFRPDGMTRSGDEVSRINRGDVLFNYTSFMQGFLQNYMLLLTDNTPVYTVFPSAKGKTMATANSFAAIPNSSLNQQNAYEFLKILMSSQIQKNIWSDDMNTGSIPVRRKDFIANIADYNNKYAGVMITDTNLVHTPIPDSDINDFIEAVWDVEYAKDFTIAYQFTWEAMEPYFKGEKSYEACLEVLRNRLNLYLHE